jgi:hypothetical protein
LVFERIGSLPFTALSGWPNQIRLVVSTDFLTHCGWGPSALPIQILFVVLVEEPTGHEYPAPVNFPARGPSLMLAVVWIVTASSPKE